MENFEKYNPKTNERKKTALVENCARKTIRICSRELRHPEVKATALSCGPRRMQVMWPACLNKQPLPRKLKQRAVAWSMLPVYVYVR